MLSIKLVLYSSNAFTELNDHALPLVHFLAVIYICNIYNIYIYMKGKKSQTQAEAKLVQLVEESFAEKATAWVEPGRRCAIRHWMLWKHNGRSMFDQLCSL